MKNTRSRTTRRRSNEVPGARSCTLWLASLVLLMSTTLACSRENEAPKVVVPPRVATPSALAAPQPPPESAKPFAPAPTINPTRAMQYVKEVVAFGARPVGSANHKKLENYILAHLKGDDVDSTTFTADTLEGKFPVRNIIAKYPGTKDGIIVVAGHYDTNYPLRNTPYVGANDGGSSTAILLELANYLRG